MYPPLHGEIAEGDDLPVPLYLQVEGACLVQPHQQADVAIYVHLLAVNAQQPVTLLQAVSALQRAAVGKARHHRHVERPGIGVQYQDNEQSRDEVHGRACREDQQLGPEALVVQGCRIIGILLFAFHGTETAHRKQPQGVLRLPLLLLPQGGPHADGKLVDPHAAGLGRHEMPQLVDGDEHAEHQYGR